MFLPEIPCTLRKIIRMLDSGQPYTMCTWPCPIWSEAAGMIHTFSPQSFQIAHLILNPRTPLVPSVFYIILAPANPQPHVDFAMKLHPCSDLTHNPNCALWFLNHSCSCSSTTPRL